MPQDNPEPHAYYGNGSPVLERFILLALVALVIAYTLAPFDFLSASPAGLSYRIAGALGVTTTGSAKLAAHFAVFFMLGVLSGVVYERSIARHGLPRFVVTAAVLCAALELIQLLHELRHARLVDFAVNWFGVSQGAFLVLRWPAMRAHRLAWQGRLQRRSHFFYGAVAALALGTWSVAGLQPLFGGLQLDWNHDYPLLIGNEMDGTKPWSGELRYIGIYGDALSGAEAGRLYRSRVDDTERDRSDDRLLVGYDFRGGSPCPVHSEGVLRSDALVLHGPQNCREAAEGRLALSGPDPLVSAGAASAIARAINSSGAFSIEAWVRPLDLVQRGHARIVTVSDGSARRNFTLGQTGTGFVFRVRNRVTGPNGTYYPLVARTAARTDWQHVVASYDNGLSVFYMDGRRWPQVLDLRHSSVFLGLGSNFAAQTAGAALLVILFALPSLGLLRVWTSSRTAHVIVPPVVFVLAAAPYLISCLSFGSPWRLAYLLGLAVALGIGYPLAVHYTIGDESVRSRITD